MKLRRKWAGWPDRFKGMVVHSLISLVAVSSSTANASERNMGPRDRYVAIGSSFASGPLIGEEADFRNGRCGRSKQNYAHLLAAKLQLDLVDVSCSGATTEDVLVGNGTIEAQVRAVDKKTALVTITIGGNDLRYLPLISAYACLNDRSGAAKAAMGGRCPPAMPATEEDAQHLSRQLTTLIQTVRARAPRARIVLLDYPFVVPTKKTCGAANFTSAQRQTINGIRTLLSRTLKECARANRITFVDLGDASRLHDACAKVPWVNGSDIQPGRYDGFYFHPNLAGMSAIASRLLNVVQ